MWCRTRRRPPALPWTDWELRRTPWKRSLRNISGASAPPDSSGRRALSGVSFPHPDEGRPLGRVSKDERAPALMVLPAMPTGRADARPMTGSASSGDSARAPPHHEEPLSPHRQRDQAERADDDAPPREQRKAVAGNVTQKRLHHDDCGHERKHETDSDDAG